MKNHEIDYAPRSWAAEAEVGYVAPDPLLAKLVSGGTFVLDAPERIPAVWGAGSEVAWAEGESLVIAGPPGVGKSTLTSQLVRARLGLQDSVLGWPVEPGRKKVLYLAMDRPKQLARLNRRLYSEADRTILDERLVVWEGPPAYDLARRTATLTEKAHAAGADTVVVDSLKDAAIGLIDDEVGAGYNRARQHALVEGVQVLELHHQRKATAGNKPNSLDDLYGSVWLAAGAGSVLLLWGSAGDPIVELLHLKQPAESIGPLRVRHDHETGHTDVWHHTDLVVLASANRGRLTARLAAMAMFEKDAPGRSEVEKARRKLDALVRSGHLASHAGIPGGSSGGTETTYRRADFTLVEGA